MNNKVKINKTLLFISVAFLLGVVLTKAYSAVDMTYQQLKILVDTLGYVKEQYVEEVDTKKLIYGAAAGIVRELDDYSQFMDPDVYKRIKSDTEGEFGGLGIRISVRDGLLTVITPLPGTPAYKAGMLPGDKIIKIEGEDSREMLPDDAINKLRGKPGTKVNITIAREPDNKSLPWITKDISLVREIIKPDVVNYRMLPGNIGYLHLQDFTGHATEDCFKAITEMKKDGMEALIFDLRYNPGGLLSSAVEVSRFFLGDNKMIVFTKGRRPENYMEYRSNKEAPFQDLPLVILVNNGSASASEIVSGAMQDNKRAVIVGMRTYGKASVQSIIPMADGSGLRLTVAKYYTPSGKSIHRNPKDNTGGIQPDIEVNVTREDELKVMEQFDKVELPKEPSKDAVPQVRKDAPVRDEILDRAVQILKARKALVNLGK